jgi:hypothetical protein
VQPAGRPGLRRLMLVYGEAKGMANGFEVDLEALEKAASGVNGTLDEMYAQKVSDIPHDRSAIGHEELADTLSDFLSRWQRGVDNLSKDGEEIAARLTANVQAYRKTETDLHNHLRRVNGELQGTGEDPGVR